MRKNSRIMEPEKDAKEASDSFERIVCYHCGGERSDPFIEGEDDLTGKPGRFAFVRCRECGLVYQNPRLRIDQIYGYYDDEYIAHRKGRNWGLLKPLYLREMEALDRRKISIVKRFVPIGNRTGVLDVGCGAGTFLNRLKEKSGAEVTGVDFIDLSALPGMERIRFLHGPLKERDLPDSAFDLITMWHFLEHDYDPVGSLRTAKRLLKSGGRLVIEVPRLDSLSFYLFGSRWPGLQAPQHTLLFTRESLEAMVTKEGYRIVKYYPYGAFPAYFYLFSGLAFQLLRGRGLKLNRLLFPYFLGQALLTPLLLFEKILNLSMQTVVLEKMRPQGEES